MGVAYARPGDRTESKVRILFPAQYPTIEDKNDSPNSEFGFKQIKGSDCQPGRSVSAVAPPNSLLHAKFSPVLGGGLEPAFRVLFSAIFHGVSLGNFHQGSNLWKGVESKL